MPGIVWYGMVWYGMLKYHILNGGKDERCGLTLTLTLALTLTLNLIVGRRAMRSGKVQFSAVQRSTVQ